MKYEKYGDFVTIAAEDAADVSSDIITDAINELLLIRKKDEKAVRGSTKISVRTCEFVEKDFDIANSLTVSITWMREGEEA